MANNDLNKNSLFSIGDNSVPYIDKDITHIIAFI